MLKLTRKLTGFLVMFSLILTGCSSATTMMKKGELTTNTKMTKTIWVKPSNNKNIYVQIKNTTQYTLNIEAEVKSNLLSKGYNVVSNPDKADYWLQANILKVTKMDLKEEESQTLAGLTGAGIGAGLGAYNTGSTNTAIALGLIGGATGIAIDSLAEDTQYIMITEVLVTETLNNVVPQQKKNQFFRLSDKPNSLEQKTQVFSIANKMNLKLEEAIPVLKVELEKAISNIF